MARQAHAFLANAKVKDSVVVQNQTVHGGIHLGGGKRTSDQKESSKLVRSKPYELFNYM